MEKLPILALASSPTNEAQLRLAAEFRDMRIQLELGQKRDGFSLSSEMAVRFEDMDRALNRTKPFIVHFSGHGSGTDGLCLEGKDGKAELISNDTLLTLFSSVSPECIILNACMSSEQATVLAGRVKYVIGMSRSISDGAAKCFSEGFYRALGEGESVIKSFRAGANAIQHSFPAETVTPCLWHDSLISTLPPKKK